MIAMNKYLHLRPNSDIWQIRLAVPSALKAQLGKAEITKSTGTSDRRVAEVIAMKFVAEKRDMFKLLAEDTNSLTALDLNGKVVELYYEKFVAELRLKRQEAGGSSESYSEWCAKTDRQRKEFVRLANIADYSRIRPRAEKFVKEHGFSIDASSEEFEDLLRRKMTAVLDALDVVLREAHGDLEAQPQSKLVRSTIERSESSAKAGERLTDYLEKYAQEQIKDRGRKPTNVEQQRASIELFIEWTTATKTVSSLTKKDAAAFRDVLSSIPKGRGRSKRLQKATIEHCIKIARHEGLPLLSILTKNRYISQLSGFFSWMYKRGYCDENIWIGMSFEADKQNNQRPPFTNDQLNTILASSLYTGFLKDGKEHIKGNRQTRDWRYWLPLLGMFTGARVTEVAQLYTDDIEVRDGQLLGHLRADVDRGQSVKTKRSARPVVFHPILLRAGFRAYWEQQVRRSEIDGDLQLFPELVAGKRPELGRRPARWFRDYLTKIGLKSGADGLGFHSFRHRLADEMRAAGYTNEEFGRLILGHSDGSMTARYGDLPQGTVKRLADMISKAEFEGVDFTNILPKSGE